ncbi:MAG: hypothetical protein ACMXYL_05210 [Candidatus Woesearchaeota archaeon]
MGRQKIGKKKDIKRDSDTAKGKRKVLKKTKEKTTPKKKKASSRNNKKKIIPKKLSKIAKKVSSDIPEIKEHTKKSNIEDKIITNIPKKADNRWKKRLEKKKVEENNTSIRSTRMRQSQSGTTINRPSTEPITQSPQPKKTESIDDTIESENVNVEQRVVSEVTYDRIVGLTEKFLEGRLSQDDYRRLSDYHRFFNSQKGFLEEYASKLNERERRLMEKTQYIMNRAPIQALSYEGLMRNTIEYQRPPTNINMREYEGRPARIVEKQQGRKTDFNIIQEKKRTMKDDYISDKRK